MNRLAVTMGALLLLAAAAAGCALTRSAASERMDVAGVVAALAREGVTLQRQGSVAEPDLTTSGEEFLTTGGTVRIFEYGSEASAALDAARLNADAADLFEPPHIYHQGNIIAVYYGDNSGVDAALSRVLGSKIG